MHKACRRLKDQSSAHIHVPAITKGLNALAGAYQRTDDQRGRLANTIERSKRDCHLFYPVFFFFRVYPYPCSGFVGPYRLFSTRRQSVQVGKADSASCWCWWYCS